MPENNESQAKTHFEAQYEAITAKAGESADALEQLAKMLREFQTMDLETAKKQSPASIIIAVSEFKGPIDLRASLMAYQRDWHMQRVLTANYEDIS